MYNKPHWELLQFGNNPEYELYDNYLREFTEISGFPMEYYIKKTGDTLDYLYGEDPLSNFEGPFLIKMVYQPGVENNLINAFGISSDDTIEFISVPKSSFNEIINNEQPKPGDIIRLIWSNRLVEISNVQSDNKIFQGLKLTWDFTCRPARTNNIDVESMIPGDLDGIIDFPELNLTTPLTEQLSAFGQNSSITTEATAIHSYDVDVTEYGYEKL